MMRPEGGSGSVSALVDVRQEIYDLYHEVCTREGLWAQAPIAEIQHFGHGVFSSFEIVDNKIVELGGSAWDWEES